MPLQISGGCSSTFRTNLLPPSSNMKTWVSLEASTTRLYGATALTTRQTAHCLYRAWRYFSISSNTDVYRWCRRVHGRTDTGSSLIMKLSWFVTVNVQTSRIAGMSLRVCKKLGSSINSAGMSGITWSAFVGMGRGTRQRRRRDQPIIK